MASNQPGEMLTTTSLEPMPEERREGYLDLNGDFSEFRAEFEDHRDQQNEKWEKLTTLLEGEPVRHFDNTVTREGGLLEDIKWIKEQLGRRTITKTQATLMAAGMGGVAVIVAALIGG